MVSLWDLVGGQRDAPLCSICRQKVDAANAVLMASTEAAHAMAMQKEPFLIFSVIQRPAWRNDFFLLDWKKYKRSAPFQISRHSVDKKL